MTQEVETSELGRKELRIQLTKLDKYIDKYETAATKTISMQDEVIEIFKDIVERECPTITNILEQFVLSYNVSRNTTKTVEMKMKASVHLLASLMDVRDQRAGNDIPVLFGFLCLCYGAGPSAIAVFQHLGLSESFQVL